MTDHRGPAGHRRWVSHRLHGLPQIGCCAAFLAHEITRMHTNEYKSFSCNFVRFRGCLYSICVNPCNLWPPVFVALKDESTKLAHFLACAFCLLTRCFLENFHLLRGFSFSRISFHLLTGFRFSKHFLLLLKFRAVVNQI